MTQENGLLPCPFCWGEAESYHAAERTPDYDGSIQGHWVVDCSECNASIEFLTTKEEAEKAWNTRTPVIPAADDGLLSIDELFTGKLNVTPERELAAYREHIRLSRINQPTSAEIDEALGCLLNIQSYIKVVNEIPAQDLYKSFESQINQIRSVLNKMRGA